MLIYNNIKEIAKSKKIPIMKIEADLGFASGSICKWNDVEPSVKKVEAVANYLNVKIEKLLK